MPHDQEVTQLVASAWPWGHTPGGHSWPHECPEEDLAPVAGALACSRPESLEQSGNVHDSEKG